MIDQPYADLVDVDAGFFKKIISLALKIKKDPQDFSSSLHGKVLYGIFQKTSTRTHLSCAKAASSLGATYVWQAWADSNFAVSDVASEAKYVSTTADAILARLLSYDTVCEFKEASTIPFINGCCDRFHPTQSIADVLTLSEHLGNLHGKKIVYMGVFNNVLNSLALALPKLGVNLVALSPIVNEKSRDARVLNSVKGTGSFHHLKDATPEIVRQEMESADAIYVDTWVDMDVINDPLRAHEKECRIKSMMPLQLNKNVYGDSNALILHCMPVHEGYEITSEMIYHDRSVIFHQAENRYHAQRAILYSLLYKN